ncbi:MAG: HAMP domain-containing histidine kinase [Candidatus Hydrogenedentes bacterium]|nr:HAMP domain-containing histidine kinase [Candidatus Hydrogenedentota bacterium]
MKPRLIAIYTVIVVLPLVVLGLLGAKLARDERAVFEHRLSQVILDQLRVADSEIARVVNQWRQVLGADLRTLPQEAGELRERARRSPYVSHYVVLHPDGALVYPSPVETPTDDERVFLERTREIWERQALTHEQDTEAVPPPQPGKFLGKGAVQIAIPQGKGATQSAAPPPSNDGWYTWYWGDGTHFIYWVRGEDGFIRAAELDSARLKSDIIITLPDTLSDVPAPTESRTALLDSKGVPIYVWGNYAAADAEKPRATLPLSYPLGGWSLAYFAPASQLDPGLSLGFLFNVTAGVLVVVVTVIALAIYFYRESSRDMREAAKRVTFVNQVSHELKTPLTNIRMYAELLEQQIDEQDERPRQHAGIIVSESQRLSRLIGNILTFNRKDRDALRLQPLPGVIDDILAEVIAHYRAALETKGIEIFLHPDAPSHVLVDADLLEQIVGNLISNVEKYGAMGKRLDIHTSWKDGIAAITVEDKGPGIPPSERDRIFQPFYRISNGLTDGVAGTGIGLTIARELARLHGGDLIVEDGEPGARFRLTLRCPLAGDTA